MKLFSFLVLVFCLTVNAKPANKSNFQNISEYLGNEKAFEFHQIVSKLEKQFHNDCGDTYCEGDFHNLTPLAFDCTVRRDSGTIGQCRWLIAGSVTYPNLRTGQVAYQSRFFSCDLRANGIPVDVFIRFLEKVGNAETQDNPFGDFTFPGKTHKFEDVFEKCFYGTNR